MSRLRLIVDDFEVELNQNSSAPGKISVNTNTSHESTPSKGNGKSSDQGTSTRVPDYSTNPDQAVPLIDLEGTAYDRGVTHGTALALSIKDNINTYLNYFEFLGFAKATILEEGKAWIGRLGQHNPEFLEEVRGISDGSSIPLNALAVLSARYEITYACLHAQKKFIAEGNKIVPDGCTSFAALPEVADGKTIIGQNWDWLMPLHRHLVVTRVKSKNSPSYISLTQAGIPGGMMGVNEKGVAFCVNGMTTEEDGKHLEFKPFHVRTYEILRKERLDQAMRVILESDRVCSTNFILAHADGEAIDLEVAPKRFSVIYPENGVISHSNHFQSVSDSKGLERLYPDTLIRGKRLRKGLLKNGKVTFDSVFEALKDHFSNPHSICCHLDPVMPEKLHYMTIASIVIDVNARKLMVSNGPPCEHGYFSYSLAG